MVTENVDFAYRYFDLIIQSCASTWNLPAASSSDTHTHGEYVIELASATTITIIWTADTNTRDCRFESEVIITESDGVTAYNGFTVNHTPEVFSTSVSH